jgi:predicted metalloprotease with PDZ domain
MRALYRDFYQKGKGFTTEDMIGIINRLTKHDYREFYRKYVSGVEVPPYDAIVGYAGYQAKMTARTSPTIGVGLDRSNEGVRISRVTPGGQAAQAGLRVGDIVLSADGADLRNDPQALISKLNEKIGQQVRLSIKRGAQEITSRLVVSTRNDVSYKLLELPNSTPAQIKIRDAWMKSKN